MEELIKQIWSSKSTYIDVDTGEVLTKYKLGEDYRIIKKKNMLEKMKQQATNMWKSLTTAEGTKANNKELISNESIKGTPFKITGNEDLGYFLSMGKYRLTEPTKTKEEVLNELEENKWQIICRTIHAYIAFNEEVKNLDLLNPVDKELINK
ncbi:MAG: hypothetical protein [Microviridae sp.]|nr:MAG: hypothetical protein [Microviridae sp.]